jgi:N-acetylglucosamine-6-phosphate deacetylase
VLSAGHSNATYEQAMHAFDNGFTTTTHLYNGMSGLQHRAPGLVGAAFEHELAKASIIPDGHHVDYAAIRIAKKQMGERLFVITDAVTETKIGNHQHQKVGDKYEVNGILSGSALTMHKALKNLVLYAGIEPDEALRMCSLYPARVLNLHESYGRIEKNFAASFAMMDLGMENVELLSF